MTTRPPTLHFCFALLAGFLGVFSCQPAHALTAYIPLGDMISGSETVVVATLGEDVTTVDEESNIPFHSFPVFVDEIVKGAGPITIDRIAIAGGTLPDGMSVWISDQPQLQAGHRYLLFLGQKGSLIFGPASALEIIGGVIPSLGDASAEDVVNAARHELTLTTSPTLPNATLSVVPQVNEMDAVNGFGRWFIYDVRFYYAYDFSGSSIYYIDSGAVAWNNLRPCVHLGDYGRTSRPYGYDGTNAILHAYLPTNILARTTVWNSGGRIYEADMQFNWNVPYTNYCAAGRYDTTSVAVHEFGHFLGLDHNWNTCSVLYPYLNAGQCKRVPCTIDRNNVLSLYGQC